MMLYKFSLFCLLHCVSMEITFTSVGKKPNGLIFSMEFPKSQKAEECSALIETSLPYFVTLPGINKLVVIRQ